MTNQNLIKVCRSTDGGRFVVWSFPQTWPFDKTRQDRDLVLLLELLERSVSQVHAASSAAAESALTEAEAICAGFGAKSTVLAVGKEVTRQQVFPAHGRTWQKCSARRVGSTPWVKFSVGGST